MKHLTALLLAVLLLLTACGVEVPASSPSDPSADVGQEEAPPPEPVPFTLAFYPEFSLHPVLAANRTNLTLAPLLYESLFTVDASFQAQPLLCQSYDYRVDDKRLWGFTLRK